MKAVITIEDDLVEPGRVSVTVNCEERPKRTNAKRIFDLIMPAVAGEFRPVRTWYRPVKGERKRS